VRALSSGKRESRLKNEIPVMPYDCGHCCADSLSGAAEVFDRLQLPGAGNIFFQWKCGYSPYLREYVSPVLFQVFLQLFH